MILFLRILFSTFFMVMAGVIATASYSQAIWEIPREVALNAWFLATLVDVYLAFFTIYLWVFFKESSWLVRILWFVAFIGLGSLAISAYCLWQLMRLPATASLEDFLLPARFVRERAHAEKGTVV